MGEVVEMDRKCFTARDLEEFDAFSARMIRAGLWSEVIHERTDDGRDWLAVILPGVDDPSYTFTLERKATNAGRYVLLSVGHGQQRAGRSMRDLLDTFHRDN